MTTFKGHLLTGDHASRPAANTVPDGTLYSCTDHGIVYQADEPGNAWDDWATITGAVPGAHAASHENGGSDEISVAGLSGLLADDQNPVLHAADHQNGGADEISVAGLSGLLADDQNPVAHAADHAAAGGDPLDVTTLDGFPGGGTTFLRDDGTFAAPPGGGGTIVQIVSTQTGAVATGSTIIPLDDTIPQNTEGTEFMTLAITPTDAANKLKIEVTALFAVSANAWLTAALFQDATANALAAFDNYESVSHGARNVVFTHIMTAGTTSATTFKVRAGPNGASTVTFNGSGGVRKYGGVAASSIVITEYIP